MYKVTIFLKEGSPIIATLSTNELGFGMAVDRVLMSHCQPDWVRALVELVI